MEALTDLLANVDTSGIQDLIIAFFSLLAKFDVKKVDTTMIQGLLDTFYPIWNPFWAWVNQLLGNFFGF